MPPFWDACFNWFRLMIANFGYLQYYGIWDGAGYDE